MNAQSQEDIEWLGDASPDEVKRVVDALHRVHRLIAAISDSDALLARITEESRQVAQAEASSLLLFDPGAEELYFHVAVGERGDQESLMRAVRLKLGQGIAGAAAARRQSIRVDDVRADERFFSEADVASQFETNNLLAVPMLDREELVGVLEVVNKQGAPAFTTLDQHALEIFSSLAATAIVNARLIEEKLRNERLAAIGQAVTGLSHYTKNIVTGLSSSTDIIEMGLSKNDTALLMRAWPVFKRSTRRISNFVQDMLSFSKPRIPVRAPHRLAAIVREADETFRELFHQKQVEVVFDIDDHAPPAHVDGPGIYRCLLNLLINAADAVPVEGGRVEVRCAQVDDGAAEIVVTDNGPGVPKEHRARIFDPFFSTKGAQGTGLGLAVTRKVLREHGGDVLLEDAPGGGARFRMVFPTVAEPKLPTIETLEE